MFNLYKRLLSYVPERRSLAIVSMALSGLASIVYVASFFVMWEFLKDVLYYQDFSKTMIYGLQIVCLMILRAILAIASLMFSHYMGFRLETNLRRLGMHKMLDASFKFFDTNSSGIIRKTIDDNAGNTHKTVAHLIPDNVTAILTPILMFILTFYIDYRLGILLLITVILGIFSFSKMYGRVDLMENFTHALERMSEATIEYLRGIQVIKIFGISARFYKALIDSIIEYKENVYRYTLSCRKPYVHFQVLFNIFYAFFIPMAIIFISRGEPSLLILAKFIFFTIFSSLIYMSFTSIMFIAMDNFQAKNAIDSLEETMAMMDEAKIKRGCEEVMEDFTIDFKDVSFKYEDKRVLDNFSLSFEGNKTYALVGPSGGGKSTIAKLISGFYPVDKGEILIGGKPLDSYKESALLKNIGFVFQDAKLFETSIYENIHLANPKASYDDVMEALELASCMDILDKFPERENTLVGSKGVHLSGGEVQRLALARVIVKGSSIIILDEATAATDLENEYQMQKAFANLIGNNTVIMIAHRLTSIVNVDQIFYIDQGQVKERGSHAELMAKEGLYYQLYNLYTSANDWRV